MVQSIVCNHGRFNATPFIESFELKCSWKMSKSLNLLKLAVNELYPFPESFTWTLKEMSETLICPHRKLCTASSWSELCASMVM